MNGHHRQPTLQTGCSEIYSNILRQHCCAEITTQYSTTLLASTKEYRQTRVVAENAALHKPEASKSSRSSVSTRDSNYTCCFRNRRNFVPLSTTKIFTGRMAFRFDCYTKCNNKPTSLVGMRAPAKHCFAFVATPMRLLSVAVSDHRESHWQMPVLLTTNKRVFHLSCAFTPHLPWQTRDCRQCLPRELHL